MVARIRSGKSIRGAINYNEHKVKEGKAELIAARGYAKHKGKLTFHEKLNRLQKLADLNTRATTHCLHVSLNFDVSENLNREKLQQIAEAYMQGIGFGGQPYLVYQHHDAAHQHVHIVSTNIQKDGKRISMHNLGRTESEKTRKEIEERFGLIRAGAKQQKMLQPLVPVNLQKVQYGKAETKRAISNIVTSVISQYKFASLPEFNAVLQQFNVIADHGAEGTRMFEKKGLQYAVINEQGNKIGVPIKASSIYGKPTLTALESKYEGNKQDRQAFKASVQNIVTGSLSCQTSKAGFTSDLKSKGIDVVFRTNEQGLIYGITYVDHNSRSVFNGSELGKEFAAAAIRARWMGAEPMPDATTETKGQHPQYRSHINEYSKPATEKTSQNTDLLQTLTDSTSDPNYLPYELRKKRKRKKRRLGL